MEDAYLQGVPKTRIATNNGVTEQSLRRHLKEHLPELLAMAREAEQTQRGMGILDRIEDLQRRTLAILEATEGTEKKGVALAAIREARANLELIGEVTKELDRKPTLNLHLNPEFIQVRTAIVQAVEPYPEARDALSRAMLQLESEASNGIN
jgi:hypothetical protein